MIRRGSLRISRERTSIEEYVIVNKWTGKQVIGLGGGVGTGKDIVLQMLEVLGAYTLDVDEIENRVLLKGAPGYQPVLESFGEEILNQTGQVDRARLYQIVRTDRQARDTLQSIIDPLIKQTVIRLIEQARSSVVVVKATNLSRFGLLDLCDHIWATTAPEEVQVANLVWKNGWSEAQAWNYIQNQPQAAAQLAHADLILNNRGSRGALWWQVTEAWRGMGGQVAPERKMPVDPGTGNGSVSSRLLGQLQAVAIPSIPSIAVADARIEYTLPIESETYETPSQTFKELRSIGRRIFNVLSTPFCQDQSPGSQISNHQQSREHVKDATTDRS